MKKWLIAAILILILPFVMATVDVVVDKTKYSLGEDILVSGKVKNIEITTDWYIQPELDCDGGDMEQIGTILQRPITEGEEIVIPNDLKIFPIKIWDIDGDCRLVLNIYSENDNFIERGESNEFVISRDLEGDFSINKERLQMGDILEIEGRIKTLNGSKIEGLADISLVSDKEWLIGRVNINNGEFEFQSNFEGSSLLNNPGEYELKILARDMYGNQRVFNDIKEIELFNAISVFVNVDDEEFMPGDVVEIDGGAKTILNDEVDEAEARIKFGGNIYKTNVRDSVFDYSLIISKDAKSGKNEIRVEVNDEFGNNGEASANVYVKQVPTRLGIKIDRGSVKPSGRIGVIPSLYDQASSLIVKDLDVEVIDPDGRVVREEDVVSGREIVFKIGQFYEPGEWKIEASYEGLSEEEDFSVEEIEEINVKLENQMLYVKNTGNSVYKDLIDVQFGEGEYSLNKKTAIYPNETLVIDLAEEVPTGDYDIEITGAAISKKSFDNVSVEGKKARSFNFIYTVLIMVLLACFIYLLVYKRKAIAKVRISKDRIYKQARKDKEKLMSIKEKRKKQPGVVGFKSREDSIKDFRKRILKNVRETEKQEDTRKKEPPSQGNMFSMFDR